MTRLSILLILALAASACTSGKTQPSGALLDAPSNLSVSNLTHESATLSWTGNAPEGYYLFINSNVKPDVTLGANVTSYTFENLTPSTEYRFGVQSYGSTSLSKVTWTETVTTPAKPVEPEPEPEPELDPNPIDPITFTWTKVSGAPDGVELYSTQTTLNGRPLQAWYAIASCSSNIQLKVLFPGNGNKRTIDQQASANEKCLVLINGGIFGTSGKPNGFAVYDGVQTPWFRVEDDNWDVDRQYWGPKVNGNADGKLHTVSRGLFGVDASGKPGVYWSYTPSHGTVYVYDKPIPSVEGEPVCPGGTQTYPCEPASWVPYNAITCGPVLLHNGRCPINDKKTSKGYWETNYEMWPGDIFGVDELHDRTAVGYLEDGRIILLVADGRLATSKGATTLEMAAIMKGLGCIGALNLDGGGSTGMWVSGKGHINDTTADVNRPVITTVGFFKK